MKATGQYFPVVLFIMLYKVVLPQDSVDEILRCAIKMKATEQAPVVQTLNSTIHQINHYPADKY